MSFPELLGIEWIDSARARIAVSDQLTQPHGLVHGGVLSSLAETIASKASDDAVAEEGMAAVGQALQITFLRPITEGHANGEGRTVHRGRTTWVWDVDITDDAGRLCAAVRMTIAIRPRR
jgi:uncharacterized protein (TIGR00369 family)